MTRNSSQWILSCLFQTDSWLNSQEGPGESGRIQEDPGGPPRGTMLFNKASLAYRGAQEGREDPGGSSRWEKNNVKLMTDEEK